MTTDRRAFRRVPGSDVPWLTAATARSSAVDVLDISDGGALIQTPVRLKPGEREVFVLRGDTAIKVAAWVLRAEITRLTPVVAYRSALRFATPVRLRTLGGHQVIGDDVIIAAPHLLRDTSRDLQEDFRRLIKTISCVRAIRISASVIEPVGAESIHFAVPPSCHGAERVLQVFFASGTRPTAGEFAQLRQLAALAAGVPDVHLAATM